MKRREEQVEIEQLYIDGHFVDSVIERLTALLKKCCEGEIQNPWISNVYEGSISISGYKMESDAAFEKRKKASARSAAKAKERRKQQQMKAEQKEIELFQKLKKKYDPTH